MTNARWIRSLGPVAVASALLDTGCLGAEREAPAAAIASAKSAASEATAPAWTELRGATFHGLGESKQPVTLRDGRWEGAPFVEGGASRPAVELIADFHLSGDLNGDGAGEAVVLLAGSSGGTGTNSYLAVAGRKEGRIENLATGLLGDRVQLRSAKMNRRRILLELVQAGPSDAACCPASW